MKHIRLSEADEHFVATLRALANPARFLILQELRRVGECQCGPLQNVVPLAQSTISEHLRRLREVGLVTGEVDGSSTCYCIDEEVFAAFQKRVAEL